MDLWLHAGIGRTGITPLTTSAAKNLQQDFVIAPGMELNFDVNPEGRTLGFYLIVQEDFRGFDVKSANNASVTASEFTPATSIQIGTYLNVVPDASHQLHLRYNMRFRHYNHARVIEVGGVALGYNVVVGKGLQLSTELFFDIPQPGEPFALSVLFGVGK